MTAFWQFAVERWQHKEVEALALSIQQQHGPVALWLASAWLAQGGVVFTQPLAQELHDLVAPVEAELEQYRQQRQGLHGAEKKKILAQELELEKALYQRIDKHFASRLGSASVLVQPWWRYFFPKASDAELARWQNIIQQCDE